MKWQDLIVNGCGLVSQVLEKALDGLTVDDLNKRPCPDCNSVGWLTWHLTRAQDRRVSNLMGEEHLWISGGWHARFNRPASSDDTGIGHTTEDVAAFKSPDAETLLGYHHAVLKRSQEYFKALTEADLDRDLTMPQQQPPLTLGASLMRVLSDNMQHAGQVAYLRGLFKGMGR